MRSLIAVPALTLLILAPGSSALAQLVADGPVTNGHHHLLVSDVEASKKFWVDALGGVADTFGGRTTIAKFPNALVFLGAGKPTAGSKGSTVDHLGFSVTNLRQVVDRIKAGGFRMVTAAEAPPNISVKDDIGIVEGTGPVSGIAYALDPDGVKVELVEMKGQSAPIASHHLHFAGSANQEMKAWYMTVFGAADATSANPAAFLSASLPGLGMNFSPSQTPVVATLGRALDHIGFEVKNLEAFTKRLESQGIKLDTEYRSVPAVGLSIAFITDPWGTRIELTEGLASIK
jgi:catechol 2,3-dioxygenase-like lactoylglutathione lyase family enzyme